MQKSTVSYRRHSTVIYHEGDSRIVAEVSLVVYEPLADRACKGYVRLLQKSIVSMEQRL